MAVRLLAGAPAAPVLARRSRLAAKLGCAAAVLLAPALAPVLATPQLQVDWAQTSAVSGASQEMRQSCAFTPAGEVFVVFDSADLAVSSATQQLLVAYDANGTSLASVVLDTSPQDVAAGQLLAVDGAGHARSLMTTGANAAVRRTELKCVNTAGSVLWSRDVDAFVGAAERARAHLVDALDRSYVVTERTPAALGASRFALSRVDANGALAWSTALGAPSFEFLRAAPLPSGDVLVLGRTYDSVTNTTLATLLRVNASGATASNTTLVLSNLPGGVTARGLVSGSDGAAACWGVRVSGAAQQVQQHGVLTQLDPSGAVSSRSDWTRPQGGDSWFVRSIFSSDGTVWVLALERAAGSVLWTEARLLHYDRQGALLNTNVWSNWSVGVGGSLSAGNAGDVFLTLTKPPTSPGQSTLASWIRVDSSAQEVETWRAASSQFYELVAAAQGPSNRYLICGNFAGSGVDVRTVQFDLSEAPQAYCSTQVDSNGCVPAAVFAGDSSAAAASGFSLTARNLTPQRNGLWLCSVNGAANAPFLGGTLCVQGPFLRGPLSNTGPAGAACSGALSLDFNTFASGPSAPAALTQPGTRVWTQAWSRDSGALAGANLSNALTFVVQP